MKSAGILPTLALLLAALPAARADITVTGSYTTGESFWTGGGGTTGISSNGSIGFNGGTGTLTITGGSTLNLANGYLGGYPDIHINPVANGSATITDGTWAMTNGLHVGYTGTGSLLINGGTVTAGSFTYIGDNDSTAQGSVTITAGGTLTTGPLYVGNSGTGSLLVNGGAVSSLRSFIGDTTNGNQATVTGQGSRWVITSLVLGRNGSNNALAIEDGGLVKVGATTGDTLQINLGLGTGNLIQLDGGTLALYGDQTDYVTSLIEAGDIQLRNGAEWVTNTDAAKFNYAYYADSGDAEAASGYADLGGYTILTTAAIPESATYAALLGAGAFLLAVQRRRR